MFRGTVRKVHALGDVSVTIDGKYGTKSLIRMKSRVPVEVGERVFVEDVSPLPNRAHDWVLFGRLTEIGQWATPAPHTHPIGQVTGLVDWLSKYETWMGDHDKRMSDADARIKAGADAVADTRAVLDKTRTDLADAVKRVAVQELFADKAGARLDQAERDIRAGGDRIGATEAALESANNSLESAKTRTETVASDLSALTGTVGDVSAAAARAQSTAEDALLVGFGRNVIPAPTADGKVDFWGFTLDSNAPGDSAGGTVTALSTSKNARSPYVSAQSGDYSFSVKVRASAPDTRFYVQVMQLAADGSPITPHPYAVINTVAPTDSWGIFSNSVTIANGTATVYLLVYAMRPNGARPEGAVQWFRDFSLRRLVPGELVVNGSITGNKIEGGSVAAAVAKFLTVSAMTGVFTKSLTATDAKLLGQTVADSFTANKVAARDIIATGTVDLAQLNVTGPMAANIINASDINARRAFFTNGLTAANATLLGQTVADNLVVSDTFAARVVNAMSTNTKRLVVTDDAILNRATVVQSLVTPELIASKVDARYLRADNIKTGMLEVFGRFRTAPDGQPQIIVQPSQSAWNSKDLAVWFTPDGTTPGGGDAAKFAVTGGMWMNPTPNGGSAWVPQELNLRGQSRAGVRIMDGLIVASTAGTMGPMILSPANQILQVTGGNGLNLTVNDGPVRVTPWGGIDLLANNGNVYVNGNEVRFHANKDGVRFTSAGGNSWQYGLTASAAANMYMDGNGKIFKSTSSRRYKKYISDASISPDGIMRLRLRKWRDRKREGDDEDMRYYRGAIAEEVADIFPEFVPTIPDPSVTDINGEPDPGAPLVPDSIEYDRLGLFVAVTGYQDLRPRVDKLEERLAALEGK